MMKTLFFLLIMLNTLVVSATQITVTIDRNPVNLSDSFQITFSADQAPDGPPDFEPLKQDFEILGQNASKQITMVNGKSTVNNTWVLHMMAKQAGTLTIPSVVFGADKSEPTHITVTQGKANGEVDTAEDIFLKVDAAPTNPYVQAQVLYTMRLYRKVNIAGARLDEPKLSDAVIQKLGEDSNYNTQINNVDYTVTERKYAVFPQKSGAMTIAPLTLTAQIVDDNGSGFNGFFNQQATRTQKITSKEIALTVRPAPTDIQIPHWLPAEDLQIKQEWSGDFSQMKTGEPITRTLVVVAKGATVGLLPELNTPSTDPALKTYPDQPTIKEMPKPEGIYAMREEKIALIPSSAGKYTLPAIEVPWFNTQTQKKEVAKIPSTTLTVIAAPQANGTPPVAPITTTPAAVTPTTPTTTTAPAQTLPSPPQANFWIWVSAFLGLGLIGTLLYFLTKQKNNTEVTATIITPPTPINHTRLLKEACQNNNPQQAKQALLQWGLSEFNVNNLGELAALCDARLRDEILQLNELLYSPHSHAEAVQHWQGKRLLQMFSEQQAAQKINTKTPEDKLEPLYRL